MARADWHFSGKRALPYGTSVVASMVSLALPRPEKRRLTRLSDSWHGERSPGKSRLVAVVTLETYKQYQSSRFDV